MPKLDPLQAFDGWELEEKLDHVRRVLAMGGAGEASGSISASDRLEGWLAPETASSSSPVTWVLTKTAVSAITCGGILAAWWWMAERQDLIKPALASFAIGHLAWFAKWCCEAHSRVPA